MCTNAPSTVDYETDNRGHYLDELDSSLKRFNGALTATMNSYRDLLSAFDKMAQVFGNLAGDLKPEVKDPIIAMRDGMRDLKDKGPFVTFNSEVHEGTITTLDPLRVDLKKAQKSLSDLKSKQKEYDSLRNKIEKKEKDYAKKDKPLTDSESYKKDIERRNKSKLAYETKRESFESEITSLKSHSEDVLLKSMNNYLHCTATFAGYLETTMNMYRTDLDADGKSGSATREIKLDRMKQEVERRSVTKRRQTAQSQAIAEHRSSDPPTVPGGRNDMYPTEDAAPTPMTTMRTEDSVAKSPANPKNTSTSRISSVGLNQSAQEQDSGRYPTERNSPPFLTNDNDGGEGLYPSEAAANPLIGSNAEGAE